jgi:hypothetical protein
MAGDAAKRPGSPRSPGYLCAFSGAENGKKQTGYEAAGLSALSKLSDTTAEPSHSRWARATEHLRVRQSLKLGTSISRRFIRARSIGERVSKYK